MSNEFLWLELMAHCEIVWEWRTTIRVTYDTFVQRLQEMRQIYKVLQLPGIFHDAEILPYGGTSD